MDRDKDAFVSLSPNRLRSFAASILLLTANSLAYPVYKCSWHSYAAGLQPAAGGTIYPCSKSIGIWSFCTIIMQRPLRQHWKAKQILHRPLQGRPLDLLLEHLQHQVGLLCVLQQQDGRFDLGNLHIHHEKVLFGDHLQQQNAINCHTSY